MHSSLPCRRATARADSTSTASGDRGRVTRDPEAQFVLSSKAYLLGEIHHCLAEINRCKSIKKTELSPFLSVQSSSRNSEGYYETQII